MKNPKALEILEVQQDAQIEHLLKIEFLNQESKDELSDALKIMTTASSYFNTVIAYTGCSYTPEFDGDVKPDTLISEMFFRTSKVMSEDEIIELLEIAELNGLIIHYEHKSMVIDELCEIYEDLEHHHGLFGLQNFSHLSDDDMLEIFGENWKMFA